MLSLGKLAPGQQAYYLDTVARGAEEYYTGAKEAPGQWMGAGAALLGLNGEVNADELHRVLEHCDPKTGTRLTRAQGAPKVPGFDATFCAPKSVSLLFALGDPTTSAAARDAHDAAVRAALSALEVEAARARRGKAGAERVAADGFVAAAFRHRTSRAADPHLHTHAVIGNLVHAPHDERWSALDARPLYGWAKTVGYLYEAQLRAELTRRLGVEWGPVRKGIADVAGIPRSTIEAFSQRRDEIEAHMEERGQTGARAAQVATYATRTAKTEPAPEGLVPGWRERAALFGLDDEALAALLDKNVEPARAPLPGDDAAEEIFARLASPVGLTAQSSSFGRREVIQGICDALPNGGDVADVLVLADEFLASEHAVAVQQPSHRRDLHLIRRLDGTALPAHIEDARFTTPELLATERRLIDSATRRRQGDYGLAGAEAVEDALSLRPSLSAEQVSMVSRLSRSGSGVEVVEGVAGSGKTFALGAAREAWEASGCIVIGAALAARAAAELETGSGIRSSTLDRLLADLDRPDHGGLRPRSVIVVDEAAMVGTRRLARLLEHAEHSGAKVVLVGDRHQLPAIDAGGAFAGLAQRLGVVTLTNNRRQVEEWERRALAELRAGNVAGALHAYQAHGRIHAGHAAHMVKEGLVADWWAARQDGGRQLMIATRHTDVDDLNRRARARLRANGQLGEEELLIGGRPFAVGDEVLATRNDYRLGILNGSRATVTAIDLTHGEVNLRLDHNRELVLPRAYIDAGHLTHGYATTLHKAQGGTLRQAFLLADETSTHQRAYSGLTRGTDRNDIYAATPDDDRADIGHCPEPKPAPLEQLAERLSRFETDTMALDERISGRLVRHAATAPLSALLAEQRRLRDRLGPQPRFPLDAQRIAHADRQRAERHLTTARAERQAAANTIAEISRLRRLLHPKEWSELEDGLGRSKAVEQEAQHWLNRAQDRCKQTDVEVAEWHDWRTAHAEDLTALRHLDDAVHARTRAREARAPRTVHHAPEVEPDLGIDLGL